jgi:hypothetical protein
MDIQKNLNLKFHKVRRPTWTQLHNYNVQQQSNFKSNNWLFYNNIDNTYNYIINCKGAGIMYAYEMNREGSKGEMMWLTISVAINDIT